MPRYAVTATNENQESDTKKSNTRNNFITTTFGKSVFITPYQMHYAIYITPNAKDLTMDFTMLAYGNRQNAIKFARANNSNLLRALKHIAETRLM